MGILNITPCKGLVGTGGQVAQAPGDIQTDQAVNISSDSTGTAFPTLKNGDTADFYLLTTDAAMYVRKDTSQGNAAAVAIGDTMLPSGATIFMGKSGGDTHIAKLDK